MKIRVLFLAGALAGMLGLAACGGDDALSAEDYYKKMGEVSAEVEKKLDENNAATPESEDPEAFKDFVVGAFDKNIPTIEDGVKKIEELSPPTDIKVKHETFVTALKAQIESLKKFKEQIEDTDPEGLEAVLSTFDTDTVQAASDAACTALQEDATSRNIDVDLDCD